MDGEKFEIGARRRLHYGLACFGCCALVDMAIMGFTLPATERFDPGSRFAVVALYWAALFGAALYLNYRLADDQVVPESYDESKRIRQLLRQLALIKLFVRGFLDSRWPSS